MRVEAHSGYSMGLLALQGHHLEGYSSSAPSHSTSLHGCSKVGREEELEWGQTVAEKGNIAISSASRGFRSVKVIAAQNKSQ